MYKLAKPGIFKPSEKIHSLKRLSQFDIKNPSLNTLALVSPRVSRDPSKNKGSLP